ncbi:hypothetical protein [Haliangium sp.]|uniref:hypothetical protein n=1 Tax=Haliangium sp. TaxID=2663208 RepID=UPI003D0D13B5
MSRRRIGIGLTLGVVAVGVGGWLVWSGTEPDRASRRQGGGLALALTTGISEVAEISAPHRCARLSSDIEAALEPTPARVLGGRTLRRVGARLEVEPALDRTLILGVVSEARGEAADLAAVRRAFVDAGVELVVSLGGMGVHRQHIEATLGALAGVAATDSAATDGAEPGAAAEARWPLLAIPGDWESIPDHRAAVRALSARGVIDGSIVRLVDIDGVRLGTLPGAPDPGRLLAGDDGCVHTGDDIAQLTATLSPHRGVRVLLAQVPPRQPLAAGLPPDAATTTGRRRTRARAAPASSSDLGLSGVHIGEPELAQALLTTPVDVVLHGLAGPDSAVVEDTRGMAIGRPVTISSGGLDPLAAAAAELTGAAAPPYGAVIVALRPDGVTWRRIPIQPASARRP